MLGLHPNRHRLILRGIAAVLAAAFSYFVTGILPYYPIGWRLLLVIVVAVVWFFHPRWGVVTALLTYILPVAYNFSVSATDKPIALTVSVLVAVVGMFALGPFEFLVLAGMVTIIAQPAMWVLLLFVPLTAAFLGARRGALLGGIGCFVAELLMLLSGRAAIGLLSGGTGNAPLVTPQSAPVKSLLDFSWLSPPAASPTPIPSGTPGASAVATATPAHVNTPTPTGTPVPVLPPTHVTAALPLTQTVMAKLFTPFVASPILLGEIGLWALGAGLAAVLIYQSRLRKMPDRLPGFLTAAGERVRAFLARPAFRMIPATLLGIFVGMLVLGIGHLVLSTVLTQTPIGFGTLASGLLLPALLVAISAPVLDSAPQALVPTFARPAHSPIPVAVTTTGAAGQSTEPKTSRKSIPPDTWSELAGVDGIQSEVLEAIDSQFNPRMRDLLRRLSLRPTRGILLFGPPGTGKTKLARVIAHEAGASFFAISGTEFTSKWVGESEANLRRIFEEAQANRPAILFFDELEAFLPKRTELSRSDAPEKGVVATFLGYTDGIGDMDGVMMVGATNYPNLIDPAALRPGRFDKVIYISAPDVQGRQLIFERYLAGKPLANDIQVAKLAERTERFTGADIQSVCDQATRRALARGGREPDPLQMADLESAIGGLKPSVTIKMLREYEAMSEQYGRRSQSTAAVDVIAKPTLTWDDVAGLESVKAALREAIEMPLAHPELFKEYGVKPSKGVLLFGPPGCGKTFLAKVVAGQAKAHFLQAKGPELLQQYVGGSEAQLRDIFIRARESAPCVLFFDEIDALAGARGTADASRTQILTQFLTEMDGVEELKGVIVVAATNRPDTIDPALMRPGRLDRILYVPPPDHAARADLIQKELADKPTAEDIDYQGLADATDGYSSADITAILNAAALESAKESLATGERRAITIQRVSEQIARTPRSITPDELAQYEMLRVQMQR